MYTVYTFPLTFIALLIFSRLSSVLWSSFCLWLVYMATGGAGRRSSGPAESPRPPRIQVCRPLIITPGTKPTSGDTVIGSFPLVPLFTVTPVYAV